LALRSLPLPKISPRSSSRSEESREAGGLDGRGRFLGDVTAFMAVSFLFRPRACRAFSAPGPDLRGGQLPARGRVAVQRQFKNRAKISVRKEAPWTVPARKCLSGLPRLQPGFPQVSGPPVPGVGPDASGKTGAGESWSGRIRFGGRREGSSAGGVLRDSRGSTLIPSDIRMARGVSEASEFRSSSPYRPASSRNLQGKLPGPSPEIWAGIGVPDVEAARIRPEPTRIRLGQDSDRTRAGLESDSEQTQTWLERDSFQTLI
jgi:hypothetical protein